MRWHWLIVLASIISCVACAPVVSREVRASVDPHIIYTDVAANPETYVGKVLLVAGTIIEVRNLQRGTRLEVL
jgi:outer membrane lipoprotein